MLRIPPILVLLLAVTGCPNSGNLLGAGGTKPPTEPAAIDPEIAPSVDELPGPQIPPLCSAWLDCGGWIPDEPKIPCRLRVEDQGGHQLFDGWTGAELRGRSSLGFPKPHISIELWEGGRTLVEPYGSWRYLDTGIHPGDGWNTTGFNDNGWASGGAPLGYGDDQATWISHGGDPGHKHITSWFRRTFQVTDPETIGPLTIRLRRDDGGIVYLNGQEVFRSNMPSGPVAQDTLASEEVVGTYEYRYVRAYVDPLLLQEGPNVVAAEVHLASPSSDDLTFDLQLLDAGQPITGNFFGMGGESDWILNGNYTDRALFRNKLSFDLYQSFGGPDRYAPETTLCELTLDGQWLGVFTLGERIKRDDDRVDLQLDDQQLGRSFIVKSDDGGGGLLASPSTYGEWFLVYPRADEVTEAEADGIRDRLQALEDATFSWDPGDPETGIFAWLDMESAVDWILIQEIAKNNDAYFLSIYLWQDIDGKLMFAPWDHDLAWGGYPVDNCGPEGWVLFRAHLVQAMAQIPEFQERLAERWFELREGPLSQENILYRLALYQDVIGDAAYDNFQVWPMSEIQFTWDDTNWLCPVESYDEEMLRFEEWVIARLQWMDANIASY